MSALRIVALLSLFAFSGCALEGEEEEAADVGSSAIGAKTQLQYIVTAHPDDEIGGWSLIERSPANYPVFIVMTQGEQTSYCTADGRAANQTALGEAAPVGNPYAGKGTKACKTARIASWHAFLDSMAKMDPTLPSAPPLRGSFTVDGRPFDVWANEKGARVVFDLGDGNLTPEEITWAIQTVRARRSQLFPKLKEYGVIGASYRNVDPRCPIYDHPDHRAIHRALFDTDQKTPGPQWGATCAHDADAARAGRVNEIDEDVFEYMMGVDAPEIDPERYPNAARRGAFQIHYGWLTTHYWPATGPSSRRQTFWTRF